MAFGIGNLGQIVSDFKESLNQIFGLGTPDAGRKASADLFHPEYGGSVSFDPTKWTGNAQGQKVRYGFTMMNSDEVRGYTSNSKASSITDKTAYYLDIPPQAITQKEIFSTNIQATRKGIIVETEGVVFKDIVIKGTTGVFPGVRGNFNGPKANLSSLTSPPTPPEGVSASTGKSTASNVKTVTGYEEFLGLRQFFLKYAAEKVKANGNLFLVFINEKDNQTLIVEPLDFTMERNSKSPMTYNYSISLRSIGTLNLLFNGPAAGSKSDLENVLEGIGNVSANLSAGIGQTRAAINATSGLFQKTFQAIDETVNGPLRQLQFALDDLANGITDTLSLPGILARNFTSAIAGIRENAGNVATALGFNNSTDSKASAADQTFQSNVLDQIQSDSRVPIPYSFVQDAKGQMGTHADNLADAVNLGSPDYDKLFGRVATVDPGPLKTVSDEEFLLLGHIESIGVTLNQVLATNSAFQSDAEAQFASANEIFKRPDLADSGINFKKPKTVRQVRIRRNDTLERIALRELQSADRWPEIVILNRLKAPYIDDAGGDGVKKPGDTLLVGSD